MSVTLDHSLRSGGQRHGFGSTRDLVSLLFRRWFIFLTVFITIAAASAFSLSRQKTVYVAEAKVLVLRGASPEQGPGQRPYLHWWEEMKSEVVIAHSREVAIAAASKLVSTHTERLEEEESVDLQGMAVEPLSPEELLAGLSVEPIAETDIIRLLYRARTGREAIDGVNALTEAYVDHSRRVAQDPGADAVLREQVELAQHEVDRLGAEIGVYKTQHGISDLHAETVEFARQRKLIESQLVQLRAERESKESQIASILQTRIEDPDVLLPIEVLHKSADLLTYKRRLAELQSRLNTLLATYTPDSPQVRSVQRDFEACVASIRNQVDSYVVAMRNSVIALKASEQTYERELRDLEEHLGALPEHEANLAALELEFGAASDHLSTLFDAYTQYRLREEVSPKVSKLRLLSRAATAQRLGGGARQRLFMVFSAVLALGLGAVAAFVVDALDHTIKLPADIEEALGVPVLASIREVDGSFAAEPPLAQKTGAS